MKAIIRVSVSVVLVTHALAGPFAPAAGVAGSDAVAAADPRFLLWANSATITRGPYNIAYPEDGTTTFGAESNATGAANATPEDPNPVVSLGDGGSAVLTLAQPFGDVPGPDFAVFENGFKTFNNNYFLELAHVEVSSDGVHFYRFPSTSLTPLSSTANQGSSVDPTNVRNLAGKYIAGYGTPFDLAEIRALYADLDTQRITHVRVIDVIGTNNPALALHDAAGRIIADPYPTEYATGGFDLDAVGAFQATTTTWSAWRTSQGIPTATVDGDSNQNGVSNLIEYLTESGAVKPSGNTLHFPRLAYRGGAKLKLQSSTDLHQWTTLAESTNGSTMVSSNTNVATVSETGVDRKDVAVQLLTNPTHRWFRLAAELVP